MTDFNKNWTKSKYNQPKTAVVNVSRRGFLKTASLAAGATFVLGIVNLSGQKRLGLDDNLSSNLENAAFQPNVFIGIDATGETFIVCSRSEMGQGIRTGMPLAIADELDADWDRVTVVQADGDAKFGNQNTDGSRSVRNNFAAWRLAGATAKSMLIAAAATKWGISASDCFTDKHVVKNKINNESLGYGALASLAAGQEVPTNPTLKTRDQWRYIGKSTDTYDNHDIVTGQAQFGIDTQIDGMLHASVERCPVIGGKLKSYNAEAALALPGVEQVIELPATTFPVFFKPLGGLAVVATNSWAAMKGREALEIEWDLGANATHNTVEFEKTLENNVHAPGNIARSSGNVEQGFIDAVQTVEATYHVPMLAHSPMETPSALAWVKEDGTCEVWASTQTPQAARREAAGILGLEQDQVTVHVTLLGGGFGRKSKPDYVAEAAFISKEAGRPIKLMWSREDEIQFDYFHAPATQYLKGGLDASGKTTSWLHRTAFPSIGSTFGVDVNFADPGQLSLGFTTNPYDIPNLQLENCEATAHVRIGWLRSVCNIQHGFAVNAFAGELAHAAGRDQKDYLLELLGPSRSLNHIFGDSPRGAYGVAVDQYDYHTDRLKGVLDLVAEKAGWGRDLPENHAQGIAVHYSFVSYVAHVVHASVEDGKIKVHRIDCAVDCGTYINKDRVVAQMEGAAIMGLTLALHGKISVKDGAVEQSNFHDYPLLRLNETPEIHVHFVENEMLSGGVGEPGLPTVAPALANAILKITGNAVRALPIKL